MGFLKIGQLAPKHDHESFVQKGGILDRVTCDKLIKKLLISIQSIAISIV